jgi:hypothetical protein
VKPEFRYTAFGLCLSASQPIPGLAAAAAEQAADVRLHLGTMPPHWVELRRAALACPPSFTSTPPHPNEPPVLQVRRAVGARYCWLHYADGTDFVLDSQGPDIWAAWDANSSLVHTTLYLFGPILALVLRQRGIVSLHASAVAWNGRVILFCGAAGAGKSTLAAAFARRGELVLADDVAPLLPDGDGFRIQPTYPKLRLWPDSTKTLFGDADALPQFTPLWEKRGLDLMQPGYRFATEPLPLGAVYLLEERRGHDAPCVEDAPATGRLTTLAANTYVNYLLDKEQRALEFAVLGRLVATTPLRCVTPHEDPARLDDLCCALLDDFRRL